MIINHNIPALNTYNKLILNNSGMSKSLEKLSSGLRINRAADDAAGLAISEKMRSQIRGLDQASRNAQDGISLIQTAEGALNETHSILQRMRELSVQAANDTYTSQDRMEIQKEIDQLTDEIDRIAATTEFNQKKLLDGSTSAYVSTDKLSTRVFMRDGLRVLDQFGQKAAGGGNYKLDIETTAGQAQVQKTDIFKIKHGTEYKIDDASGVEEITAEGLRYGDYTIKTGVGATLATGTENTVTTLVGDGLVTTGTSAITEDMSGTFAVKITGVDIDTQTLTYEVIGKFYGLDGTLIDETKTTNTLVLDRDDATTAQDIAIFAGGAAGITVDFKSAEIADYKVDEKGVFAVSAGNSGSADLMVDTVTINSSYYDAADAVLSFNTGTLNAKATEFEIVQFDALDKIDTGSFELTIGALANSDAAVTFDFQGEIGQLVTLDTKLYDIDKFWDASGNFILETPQVIGLVQGDGSKTNITLSREDTIGDVVSKLNAAIADGLGQKNIVGSDFADKFVSYVAKGDASEEGLEALEGTFVIRSAIAGNEGTITFVGDDATLAALSLQTIQAAENNSYNVDVTEVHEGTQIAKDVKISENNLVGVVHENADVQFAANTGIVVTWDDVNKTWTLTGGTANAEDTFVHLADNSLVLHIGANQKQDIGTGIGDMSARSLGVNNIQVTSNTLANQAIGKLDGAIARVSSERSKLGALQNRLDHTINNLSTTSENLTAAESRIRDVDMAKEMMVFTKYNILSQAATAMLAQANQMPQSVLQLLR